MKTLAQKLEELPDDTYRWQKHKFKPACRDVISWKKHVMRSINQDQAAKDLVDATSPENAFILCDFAMKVGANYFI